MEKTFNYILVFFIAVIISLVVYQHFKYDPTEHHYQNINLRIVSINSECSLTQDKFHNPQLCNTILFETITGPKLYVEINTCSKPDGVLIDTPWLYNHWKGDTVHFDFLAKKRFFTIQKR